MKIRTQFIILLVLGNGLLLTLSALLYSERKLVFVAAEALILISIVLSVRLYTAYIRPLNLIAAGIEAIWGKDFNTRFAATGQEEVDQLIAVYNHMIDQLRDERTRQQEQHLFLDKLIEASPVGILILDTDERIMALNHAAAILTGLEPEQACNIPITTIEGTLFQGICSLAHDQSTILTLSGQRTVRLIKSHFVEQGFRQCFILIEELTDEIYRTEKQAYEKVIRIMSHEVNNSVGAVNSILNSVLDYHEQLQAGDRDDFIDVLQVAIDRNAKLNHFMTNFADVIRTPSPHTSVQNLHPIIERVVLLMTPGFQAHRIDLKHCRSDALFLVNIDSRQIEQVLVNILKNAGEAIGENGWIELETRSMDQKTLSIRNNGTPISSDVQAHLFTPFYTTKHDGQGIGLTLTQEILRNHGFSFSLETDADGITVFTINFS